MPADPLLDATAINSPGWWLDRLSRKLLARQTDMQRYADYYAGKHRLTFATQKFREAFGDLFKEVAVNFCEVVVDKLVERLEVQGFRFKAGQEANDRAWDIWQRNNLDADFAKGIREGLTKGEFSMTVWAGEGVPRLTVEDPLTMIVSVDPSDTRIRRAALKRWYDADLGQVYATLYMPDYIYKYRSKSSPSDPLFSSPDLNRLVQNQSTNWERRQVEGEEWPLPNALGVIPVIPFPNKPDLGDIGVSELKNVIPIQDAFNKTTSDLLLASEYAAYPQKYATNIVLEIDPDTGKPKEPWKLDIARMLTAPPPQAGEPDTKFGQFEAADLAQYVSVLEMYLKHLAVITRMPPHYLLGNTGVFPSGESLKSAETGLVRKARDRMRDLSEPLEEVIRVAFLVAGDADLSTAQVETLWANPETQSESSHVDALVKLRDLGVPEEGIWEKIPASPTEIAKWKDLKAEAEPPPAPPTQLSIARNAVTGVTSIGRVPVTE